MIILLVDRQALGRQLAPKVQLYPQPDHHHFTTICIVIVLVAIIITRVITIIVAVIGLCHTVPEGAFCQTKTKVRMLKRLCRLKTTEVENVNNGGNSYCTINLGEQL